MLTVTIAQLSCCVNSVNIAQRSWVKHQLPFSCHWAQYFFAIWKCLVMCFHDVIASVLYRFSLHPYAHTHAHTRAHTHTHTHLCSHRAPATWVLLTLCPPGCDCPLRIPWSVWASLHPQRHTTTNSNRPCVCILFCICTGRNTHVYWYMYEYSTCTVEYKTFPQSYQRKLRPALCIPWLLPT